MNIGEVKLDFVCALRVVMAFYMICLCICIKAMVTNVTSLLKTVKSVEDEAAKGPRAIEQTIHSIKQELRVTCSLVIKPFIFVARCVWLYFQSLLLKYSVSAISGR